jgi:hypothetical protein
MNTTDSACFARVQKLAVRAMLEVSRVSCGSTASHDSASRDSRERALLAGMSEKLRNAVVSSLGAIARHDAKISCSARAAGGRSDRGEVQNRPVVDAGKNACSTCGSRACTVRRL